MMEHRVVSDNGLASSPEGCVIDIRLPWYRSLPLSVVQIDEVQIDGEVIDKDKVTFELEGERMPLSELRPKTGTVWYVLDSAFLHIDGIDVAKGSEHEVAVTVSFRPPYIAGLNRIVKTTKTFSAN